jgi:hypothetical protein
LRLGSEVKQKNAEKSLQDFVFAQKEDVRRFKAMEKQLKDGAAAATKKEHYIQQLVKEND